MSLFNNYDEYEDLMEGIPSKSPQYRDDLRKRNTVKKRIAKRQSGGMKIGRKNTMIYFYTLEDKSKIKQGFSQGLAFDTLKSVNPRVLKLSNSQIKKLQELFEEEHKWTYEKNSNFIMSEILNTNQTPILMSKYKLFGKNITTVDGESRGGISAFNTDNQKVNEKEFNKHLSSKVSSNKLFNTVRVELSKSLHRTDRSLDFIIQKGTMVWGKFSNKGKVLSKNNLFYPMGATKDSLFTVLITNRLLTAKSKEIIERIALENGLDAEIIGDFFIKFQ